MFNFFIQALSKMFSKMIYDYQDDLSRFLYNSYKSI